MKAVMISIQPKFCELITSGKKTIEVRKTRPKIHTPFKCYIYETKSYDTLFGKGMPKKLCVGGGYVIGEFVCDSFYNIPHFLPDESDDIQHAIVPFVLQYSCLQDYEIDEYLGAKDGYGWHISDLVIYDKPKGLSEFYFAKCVMPCEHKKRGFNMDFCMAYENGSHFCKELNCDKKRLTRPPQSWQYVEEKE